jgi:biopolymer transport protein ExbB
MNMSLPASLLMAVSSPISSTDQAAPPADLWHIIQSGGAAMYPLGAISILGVMLIIVLLVSVRRGAVVSHRYMQAADALIRKRDYLALLALSHRHNEAIASVMERALNFLTKNENANITEVREIAQAEGVRLSGLWSQRVSYLADIGALAPMLGLLGTVLGMIKSFAVVSGDMTGARQAMLAGGVAEAFVATAAGLLIGIPAMAAYAFFRGRVQLMISDLEAASTLLMAQIVTNQRQSNYRD